MAATKSGPSDKALSISLADRHWLTNLPGKIFSACMKFGGSRRRDADTPGGQTDTQTHRLTDRQTERQTHINKTHRPRHTETHKGTHTHTHTHKSTGDHLGFLHSTRTLMMGLTKRNIGTLDLYLASYPDSSLTPCLLKIFTDIVNFRFGPGYVPHRHKRTI